MGHFSKIKCLLFPVFICKQISQHSDSGFSLKTGKTLVHIPHISTHQGLRRSCCLSRGYVTSHPHSSLLFFAWSSSLAFLARLAPIAIYVYNPGLEVEVYIRLSKTLENYLPLDYKDSSKGYLWENSVYVHRNRDMCPWKCKPNDTWYKNMLIYSEAMVHFPP